jgi:hypothetical protein
MPIEFNCEACAQLLRVPDNSGGQSCQCPSCQEIVVIPDPAGAVRNEINAAQAAPGDKLTIACPQCSHKLICSAELLDTKGQCRNCQTIFTISRQGAAATATPIQNTPGWVFNCPTCDQLFEGQAEMEGRKGKCHACGEVFAIELKPAIAPGTAARPSNLPKKTISKSMQPGVIGQTKNHSADTPASTPEADKAAKRGTRSIPSPSPAPSASRSSASIQFACKHCQGVMEVPGSTAGRTTQCPYCQQLLSIPQHSTYLPSASSSTSSTAAGYFSPHAPAQPQVFPADHSPRAPYASASHLGDYSGANLGNAYATPYLEPEASSDTPSEWSQPRKKKIRGLSFSNAFELTFASLFPYSLAAAGLFTLAGGLALILVLGAGFLGGFSLQTLELTAASTAGQVVIYGLLAVAVLTAVFLVTAVYCMTCNTALHVMRGQKITSEVLFGTGESYGGMLVIMLGWTGLNFVRKFGVPWVARSFVEAGQEDIAITLALTSIGVLYFLQVALTLLLAYVPFALLDGQSLSDAIGTSVSIFFGNFLTVLAVGVCGGLLYALASVLTCGMGFIVFIGSLLYLHASVYHLAVK